MLYEALVSRRTTDLLAIERIKFYSLPHIPPNCILEFSLDPQKIEMGYVQNKANTMDSLNLKLSELEKKQQALQKKKEELDDEEIALIEERRRLEEERLLLSQKLSQGDEAVLRRELTALGKLFDLREVVTATFRVLPGEPRNPGELYNIFMKCGISGHSGVIGISVTATLMTQCPEVEAVVKSMFEQEGYVQGRANSDLHWEKHWDYYTRIVLKNPSE